jgi:DNA-binding NtrC family response regulator
LTDPDRKGDLRLQILAVDSDRRSLSLIDRALRPLRLARMTQVPNLAGAKRCLENSDFDLIIAALELRDGDGMELFEKAKDRGIPVIMASGGFGQDISLKILAYERARIIEKPLETDVLTPMVESLMKLSPSETSASGRAELLNSLRPEQLQEVEATNSPRPFEDQAIIGEAAVWKAALAQIAQVADTRAEVLLLGESGTGKELVAKAVHSMSPRAGQAFVAVNCAAIPANLLESELFGHIKGAFTGAIGNRTGRFKEADRGTIFLDEIGELPLDLQAKLLRVLQEKRFTPVGADKEIYVDFRVVAATNIALKASVAAGSFREDLFHRLYVFPVLLPPLRQRRVDIPILATHFLAEANAEFRRRVDGFSAQVLAAMSANNWPGNVRQLENTVRRLVIITGEGEIQARHIPEDLGFDLKALAERLEQPESEQPVLPTNETTQLPAQGLKLRELLVDLENDYIDQALIRTEGNRNQAARLLGLNRTTLVEKLRKRGR